MISIAAIIAAAMFVAVMVVVISMIPRISIAVIAVIGPNDAAG